MNDKDCMKLEVVLFWFVIVGTLQAFWMIVFIIFSAHFTTELSIAILIVLLICMYLGVSRSFNRINRNYFNIR
jgi:hypothetical protein